MPDQPVVEYDFIENALHVFTFHDKSRTAADEYIRLQNEALESWIIDGRTDEPFLMILDISQSGLFPISHTLTHSMKLLSKYQQIPNRYFAYITDNRNDLLMLCQLAEGGGTDWDKRRQIFAPDEIEDAKQWLLTID
jgi:hypothetical protein